MKRFFVVLLSAVILLLSLTGCNTTEVKDSDTNKTRISDFSQSKVGSVAGSIQSNLLKELLPDAEHVEYSNPSDSVMALMSDKIETFSTENSVLCAMQWEGIAVKRVEEPIAVSNYGFMFNKGEKLDLQKQLNEFIKNQKTNGKLKQLQEKWFSSSEPSEFADYEKLSGKNGTIRVAICSEQKPFVYIKNAKYAGYDIEFLTKFAGEYGYNIEFFDSSFTGILSGIKSGIYDIGASGATINEERKNSLDFSDVYYSDEMVLVVKSSGSAVRTLDDFKNATLGVIVGSIYDGYSKELFPDANIDAYQSFPDLFQCVKQGKVDGFLLDMPNYNAAKRTDKGLSYIKVPDYNVEIGYAFGKNEKGSELQTQMNAYLDELRAEGTLDKIWDKWCGTVEPTENIKIQDLSANEKELKIALDSSRKPFVYMLNNEHAGFEVEILYMFCEKYGYKPKFEDAQWTAGVAGLTEGKYDVVSCGIYITDERKESVNFCEPYMVSDIIMVIYENDNAETDFLASIKESFEKTFIRESRWKLIVKGLAVTVLISFCSVVGGTVFGFVFYMISRSKYKLLSLIAKKLAKVHSIIISGTPILVILMILYYLVFAKADISGIIVAIIGFIMTFSSFVYGQLDITVENVDKGQTEAAYALGYSRNKTFFKIILPQAMKMFIPAYTGEIIGLIKATSIVGYIAVNDLTRMGDIIRSNTYEAFFPLIAVALIYFALIWIVTMLMGIAKKKTDPKRRKNKSILKGVVR